MSFKRKIFAINILFIIANVAIFTNANAQIRVTATGRVGIGINSLFPNNLFQVDSLLNFGTATNFNTSVGKKAGIKITTGAYNTFTGYNAAYATTTGSYNTAVGVNAAIGNTSGSRNTYMGYYSGRRTTTASDNTFVGYEAGDHNATGYTLTMIGTGADVDKFSGQLYNSTCIGFGATAYSSNTIVLGNSAVEDIIGFAPYTNLSDGRYKTNVKENIKGLEFITKLRPVSYQLNTKAYDKDNYKNFEEGDSINGTNMLDLIDYTASMEKIRNGFIAQEVDSVAKACGFTNNSIVHKKKDKNETYTLAYSEFVVPLVKAVQELNTIITDQKEQINALEIKSDEQQKTIKNLENDMNNCCAKDSKKGSNNTRASSGTNSIEAKLHQNIPNPFNVETTINYFTPEDCTQSSIIIFDMNGKLIKTYNNLSKGNAAIQISSNELKPGMYLYSLICNAKEIDTKRMILTE